MGFDMAVLGMHILAIMFFAGLLGCVAVVIISWISVGKDSFSNKP